jgi:iron-sulfur cluster assembly protein
MINVTDNAASQILKLIDKQHQDATGLRVGVKAGGCSGFEYVFA